jgi:hypothetical protein
LLVRFFREFVNSLLFLAAGYNLFNLLHHNACILHRRRTALARLRWNNPQFYRVGPRVRNDIRFNAARFPIHWKYKDCRETDSFVNRIPAW